jgi:hypothetical protein
MCEYFSLPRLSVRSLQGGRLNVLQAVLRKYEALAAYTAINFFLLTGILHFYSGRCFAMEMNIVGSGWPRKERGCKCSEQLTDQFS